MMSAGRALQDALVGSVDERPCVVFGVQSRRAIVTAVETRPLGKSKIWDFTTRRDRRSVNLAEIT